MRDVNQPSPPRMNPLLRLGLFNLFSGIPATLLTSFAGLLLLVLFPDFLDHHEWLLYLPLLLSPASCIWGIIHGIRQRKENRHGLTCIILSVLGLLLFPIGLYWVAILGISV